MLRTSVRPSLPTHRPEAEPSHGGSTRLPSVAVKAHGVTALPSVAATVTLVALMAGLLASCGSSDQAGQPPSGDEPALVGAPGPAASSTPDASASAPPPSQPTADPEPDPPAAAQPQASDQQGAPVDNPCRSGQVTGVEADQIPGATSTKVLYVFRTSTGAACTLLGYPQVTLLDAAGTAIPVRVDQGGLGLPETTPRAHELTPEGSLSFLMAVPPGSAPGCPSAATVRVALPADGGTVDIASDVAVCADAISVTPFQLLAQGAQLGD